MPILAFYVCFLSLYYGCYALSGIALTAPDIGDQVFGVRFQWGALILVLINPFFEELIVRAYLMTEVKFLTGSATLSIAASVGLQTLSEIGFEFAGATGECSRSCGINPALRVGR